MQKFEEQAGPEVVIWHLLTNESDDPLLADAWELEKSRRSEIKLKEIINSENEEESYFSLQCVFN